MKCIQLFSFRTAGGGGGNGRSTILIPAEETHREEGTVRSSWENHHWETISSCKQEKEKSVLKSWQQSMRT